MNHFKTIKTNRGYTLVEVVITIVVLGIALTALSGSLFDGIGRNADPMWQVKSTQLAQAYLDEITSMRFQEDSPLGGGSIATCNENGPEAGETNRSLYDDVDDYHNLTESGDFLDIATSSDYSQYSITIQVDCKDAADNDSLNSKIIEVTITAPGNRQLRFASMRGNF